MEDDEPVNVLIVLYNNSALIILKYNVLQINLFLLWDRLD